MMALHSPSTDAARKGREPVVIVRRAASSRRSARRSKDRCLRRSSSAGCVDAKDDLSANFLELRRLNARARNLANAVSRRCRNKVSERVAHLCATVFNGRGQRQECVADLRGVLTGNRYEQYRTEAENSEFPTTMAGRSLFASFATPSRQSTTTMSPAAIILHARAPQSWRPPGTNRQVRQSMRLASDRPLCGPRPPAFADAFQLSPKHQ